MEVNVNLAQAPDLSHVQQQLRESQQPLTSVQLRCARRGQAQTQAHDPASLSTIVDKRAFSELLDALSSRLRWKHCKIVNVHFAACPSSKALKNFASAIAHNSSVQSLSLRGARLGDEAFATLHQGIMQNKSIEFLDLTHCSLSDASARSLASVVEARATQVAVAEWQTHLRTYTASKSPEAQSFFEPSGEHLQLRELHLDFNHISDVGATAIANKLANDAGMISLSLRGNNLGSVSRENFQTQLRMHPSMKSVDLRGNTNASLGVLIAHKEYANQTSVTVTEVMRSLDVPLEEVVGEALRSPYITAAANNMVGSPSNVHAPSIRGPGERKRLEQQQTKGSLSEPVAKLQHGDASNVHAPVTSVRNRTATTSSKMHPSTTAIKRERLDWCKGNAATNRKSLASNHKKVSARQKSTSQELHQGMEHNVDEEVHYVPYRTCEADIVPDGNSDRVQKQRSSNTRDKRKRRRRRVRASRRQNETKSAPQDLPTQSNHQRGTTKGGTKATKEARSSASTQRGKHDQEGEILASILRAALYKLVQKQARPRSSRYK